MLFIIYIIPSFDSLFDIKYRWVIFYNFPNTAELNDVIWLLVMSRYLRLCRFWRYSTPLSVREFLLQERSSSFYREEMYFKEASPKLLLRISKVLRLAKDLMLVRAYASNLLLARLSFYKLMKVEQISWTL
jgi:hypothetical protein